MKFPRLFYADRTAASAGMNAALQRHAARLLRRVAHDLQLRSHEIVVQPARLSSRSRVSLRTGTLFVDVLDKPCRQGVALSFRTRRGRWDLTGGGENHVSLEQLETYAGYQSFLEGLRLASGINSGEIRV
jgi:hypothetical protein